MAGKVLPSLDGLRAVSILLVLLGHAIGSADGHSLLFRFALLHPELGVEIFFIISGFLITTLLMAEKAEFGSVSLRLFYMRRALRIFPPFFVFVACVFALTLAGVAQVPARLWAYVLTWTVNFAYPTVWTIGHLWSLSVEEQFYLLWPVAMAFAGRRSCVAIAGMAVFGNIILDGRFVNPSMRYAFPLVCGPIAMGCLLAIFTPQVSSLKRFFGTVPLVIAAVTALVIDTATENAWAEMAKSLLLTFCVAKLVFQPHGLVPGILNSRPVVFAGKLSYSLYLWQQLFLNPFSDAAFNRFPLNICEAIAAALLSYYLVERNFFALRARFRRTPCGAAT